MAATLFQTTGAVTREDEMADLEQRDAEILDAFQRDFPIASTPYAMIGQMVDMSEKEVIKRAIRLRQSGALRPIQIRFDPRALGCSVALVIAAVPEDLLESAAAIVTSHPGVSQNYRRNHEFNLWFTLCLPPDSALGMEETVRIIAAEAQVDRIHALPAIYQYREGVLENDTEIETAVPDETGRRRIRLLQDELPVQPRPFDVIARKLDEPPEDLIEFIRLQKELGTIQRIGPVVVPQKARFSTSAMGVWNVPPERIDQVAKLYSEDERISSCTIRDSREDWPYNLFTIIQGRSVDECESTMKRLAEMGNLEDYRALFPLHEYKQTRMNLFPAELNAWERTRSDGASSRTAAS